jgi:hypothetical protein
MEIELIQTKEETKVSEKTFKVDMTKGRELDRMGSTNCSDVVWFGLGPTSQLAWDWGEGRSWSGVGKV